MFKSLSVRPSPKRKYSRNALFPEPRPPMNALKPLLKTTVTGADPVRLLFTRSSTKYSVGVTGGSKMMRASSASNA